MSAPNTTTQEAEAGPTQQAPNERTSNSGSPSSGGFVNVQLRRLAAQGFDAQEAALAPLQLDRGGPATGEVHTPAAHGTRGSADQGGGGQAVQRKVAGAAVQRDGEQAPAQAAPPTVAEVSNVIRDPPYGWTSAYQVTITGAEIQLLIKVRLIPDEGVTPEQIADVQTRTQEGVSTYLDNKFTFTDNASHTAYALRVAVQFVDSGEHLAVNLHPGNSGSNLANWYVQRPTATFAHELGHQLGLKDEYISASVPSRANAEAPGVHTDHSLMGDIHAEGHAEARLHARHGTTIAGHVGGATGRTFTVTRN